MLSPQSVNAGDDTRLASGSNIGNPQMPSSGFNVRSFKSLSDFSFQSFQ
jgi:hypothetical protein